MPTALTLLDFSDRDLLNALTEAGDNDGWATAEEVARLIGIDHEHPSQCVGMRFAWLRKFGVLDTKNTEGVRVWRLNAVGVSLMYPKHLPAAVQRALASLDEGQRVQITEAISRELRHTSREGIHISRRAWQHNFGGWKDPKLAHRRNGNR